MDCGTCGFENASGSELCSRCGATLGRMTRDAVDPASRLMGPHRAERRQVTALVCDLVDSVSLTTRLDPEDMMSVVDAYLATCEKIIARHGGYITQYTGDGVLAYFGYPHADEDAPANAVRAGIEVRDSVGQLGLPRGLTLQTRVGIATGLVVIGDPVGRRAPREVDIVGQAPNLAARLQSVAAPDSIVVAKSTQRITGGLFNYRDLGAFALKGFAAPVEAFEALEATGIASRFHARVHGSTTPLVGRDKELVLLLNCWAGARAGKGHVVLLHGEPGIGKSRLVEELRRRTADVRDAQTMWYCGPTHSDSALYPVSQQIARAAGFDAGDSIATRRDKLGRLLAQYGAAEPLSQAVFADLLGLPSEQATPIEAMTPEKRKEVTQDALLGIMDRWTTSHPALFVLEDAHWSDSATLGLLDRTIARAADRHWLILVTARPEYQPAWAGHANVTHLRLGRLDRGDAERLCVHFGPDLLPAASVRQIVARCDGIPLFVEEMTKSVLEAAAASPAQEGPPVVAIPMSVQDSLIARLDRLGPARRIANLGAAIGRRFSYQLLAAVAEQPDAQLRLGLRDLTLSGLVESSGLAPNSIYLFKHALIRDAAYESLLKREREMLHGRIAAVLRDRFPETREAEPELLAYHFTESGAISEAIPLWATAGQRAASRAAHVEAVRHFQTALDLLRRQDADGGRAATELQLLIGLAVSLAASRGYSVPEVGKALAEARAICDALGNVAGLFAVLRGICDFMTIAGDLDGSEEMARLCITIGEQTGLAEHRIESASALGYILFAKGDLPSARQHLEGMVQLYAEHDGAGLPRLSSQDPLVLGLAALLQILNAMGDDAGAARVAAQLAAHARLLARPFDLAWALSWLALYRLARGDFAEVSSVAEEALGICKEHGYTLYQLVATSLEAHARGHLGQPDQALDTARGVLPAFEKLGMKHFSCFYLGEVAGLEAAIGDAPAALRSIDAAIEAARRYGDGFFLSPLYRRRAEIVGGMPGTAAQQEVAASLREAVAIAEAQGAAAFAERARGLQNAAATRLAPDHPEAEHARRGGASAVM
jgi:class 3 adenylate cyclase/tetratricopeptide (TPR) repeat protein